MFQVRAGEFAWQRPRAGMSFTWAVRTSPKSIEILHTKRASKGAARAIEIESLVFEEKVLLYPAAFDDYYPLEETGLFKIFADTEDTEGGVLAFANRYGRLTPHRIGVLDETNIPSDAESLNSWRSAITTMRSMVVFWDDARRLSAGTKQERAMSRDAYCVLSERITAAAAEMLLPAMVMSPAGTAPELKIVPTCLLGCMYLQLAAAVAGDKSYQQCPACGKWFELLPGVNRANKQACSDSCRTRLYRERQARARQMEVAGKKPIQIARELGSDVRTVRGWLSPKKG